MRIIKYNNGLLNPWLNLQGLFDDNAFDTTDTGSGLNLWEDSSKVYVQAAVPGLSEKDIDVNIENGVLTVRGASEKKENKEEKGVRVYTSSLKNTFYYSTSLPGNIDPGKVDAELENGVLTVSIDKASEAKPRKIDVKTKSLKGK